MKIEEIIFLRYFQGIRRCSMVFFFLCLLLSNGGCQPQYVAQKGTAPPSTEAELFKAKCSKCHDLERALKKYRSADVWRDTITRMRSEHNADITNKEIDRLVKYHVERQRQETEIFDEKCQKCHPGKVFLEQNLTPDQAKAIIRRMQQKAGNTIEEKDVEIIVNYHIRSHQTAMEENFRNILRTFESSRPDRRKPGGGAAKGAALFVEKCSTCHEPERALSVIKDPEVWAQTVKRMQYYSKGEITDEQVNEIVDFHVSEQQLEIETFQQTCTRCHDDERINSRSMSEDEWLATIKRMQQKAPDLITDEKITLIAAYFHRRELTMARIFYGKCQLCHYEGSWDASSQSGTIGQMNDLIVLADEEIGKSRRLNDVNILLNNHVQRQKRNMQLFVRDCAVCHIEGIPDKIGKADKGKQSVRNRAEWISFIATLQGVELNKDTQDSINSQIEYHVSRF